MINNYITNIQWKLCKVYTLNDKNFHLGNCVKIVLCGGEF